MYFGPIEFFVWLYYKLFPRRWRKVEAEYEANKEKEREKFAALEQECQEFNDKQPWRDEDNARWTFAEVQVYKKAWAGNWRIGAPTIMEYQRHRCKIVGKECEGDCRDCQIPLGKVVA